MLLAALAEAGIGIFCLYLANVRFREAAVVFVLMALGCFALAGFCVWGAIRSFPPSDDSSKLV
jgi:hypothetical protein